MNVVTRRCWAGAAALLLDRVLREPPNAIHPVAMFGRSMTAIEHSLWSDDRQSGAAYTAVGVFIGAMSGRLVRSTAFATFVAVAGRELRRIGRDVGEVTVADNLGVARARLPALVGRDPTNLDASAISAAVIESMAENTVDAVVAPVFWGVVAGAPGAGAYRAVNTMDAMVGHRSDRYLRFGWASARLDDVANYLPARLFAVLVGLVHPGNRGAIRQSIAETAAAHPSPNAGVAEAALAGALGVQLGGPLYYGDRLEIRPVLGHGRRPQATDINSAIKIVDDSERLLAAGLVAIGLLAWMKDRYL